MLKFFENTRLRPPGVCVADTGLGYFTCILKQLATRQKSIGGRLATRTLETFLVERVADLFDHAHAMRVTWRNREASLHPKDSLIAAA